MAFYPVSGSPIQYSNENNELASDHWLKFYIANTTSPISMYLDDAGSDPRAKVKLNTNGMPITDTGNNDSVFIPYIDQKFRYVVYKTEADADADNTAAAFVNVAEVNPLAGLNNVGTASELDVTTSDEDITSNRVLRTENKWHTAQTGDFLTYGGTANAITLTSVNTTPVTSLITGQKVRFRATAANTGATTINVDGLGATACVTPTGVALPADFIRTDVDTEAVYDGSDWVVSRKVESGSNANGKFTRWEDGTMICFNGAAVSTDVASGTGSVFRGSDTWTYPQEFTTSPVISSSTDSTGRWAASASTITTTSATITQFGANSSASLTDVAAEAVGFWY